MSDDVTVVRDEIEAYADETVARVRILSVPTDDRFPEGIKYTFHYGGAGAEHPTIRFDNHHGVHELHLGATTYTIDYPGQETLYRSWRAALPPENVPTGSPPRPRGRRRSSTAIDRIRP